LTLIKKAINSLPEDQKTVVALRDIEGLSYDEIADITGLNLGTVKSKLARARMDLREKLKDVI
jgi:RNA polymerase sigma-70 factor (ECF subfamily)